MKKILLLILFVSNITILKAQDRSKNELFESFITQIEKSHSTLSDSSFYTVLSSDENKLNLTLQSREKSKIYEVEDSFVLDLNDVTDTYVIPQKSGFTLIVNLKVKALITKKKIDFENLFHKEIVTESLREESDLWFLFSKEIDANNFEKALIELKKAK